MNIKRFIATMLIFMMTIVAIPVYAADTDTNWTALGKAFETDLNTNQNLFYLKTMEGIINQGNLTGNNSTNAKYNEVKAILVAKALTTMLDEEITAAQTAKSSLHAQFVKDEITMITSMKPELKKSFEPLVAKYTAMDAALTSSAGTKQLIVKPKDKNGKNLGIDKTYDKLPDYKAVIAPRIIDGHILVGQEVFETKWPAENMVIIEPVYEKVTLDAEGWIGSMPYRLQAVDEKNQMILDQVVANSELDITVKAPKIKRYTTIGQTTRKVSLKNKFTPVVFNVKKVALPDLTNVTKKNDEVCPLLFVDDVMKDQRLVRDEVELRQDGSCFRIQVYENEALVNVHREKSKLGKQVVKLDDYINTFTEYGYAGTQPDTPTDQKIDKPYATLESTNKPQLKDGEAKIIVIYYDEVEKKEINKVEKDKLKFGKYTIKPQAPKDYYLLEDKSVELEITEKEPIKEIKYLVRPNASGSATVTIYHIDIDANEILKEEVLHKVPVGEHSIKPYPFKDYDPAFSGDIKFTVTKDGEKVQKVAKYYKYLTKSERDKIGKYTEDRNYKSGDKPNSRDKDTFGKDTSGKDNLSTTKPNKPVIPTLPDIFPPSTSDGGNSGSQSISKVDGLSFRQGAYMKGYPDGSFKPSNTLTRAEAASILYNSLNGLKSGESVISGYEQLPGWAQPAIDGITSDVHPLMVLNTSSGFRAGSNITRAEFIDALVRAYGQVYGGSIEGSMGFSDTSGISNSAHIAFAREKGLVSGYPDGSFKPYNTLTRAEAAAMANAVFKLQAKPGATSFYDVPATHWAAGIINAATK